MSRHSGQCLDVFGASTDAAASVIQWTCHGGANQQWRLEPAGGGAVRILARHSGQALDVFGALVDDVTPIIQCPVHGGDNQVWTLEPAPDGHVRIVARHSGKVLDVEFASVDDGTRDPVHRARRHQPAVASASGRGERVRPAAGGHVNGRRSMRSVSARSFEGEPEQDRRPIVERDPVEVRPAPGERAGIQIQHPLLRDRIPSKRGSACSARRWVEQRDEQISVRNSARWRRDTQRLLAKGS